jgi:hypothetical protein
MTRAATKTKPPPSPTPSKRRRFRADVPFDDKAQIRVRVDPALLDKLHTRCNELGLTVTAYGKLVLDRDLKTPPHVAQFAATMAGMMMIVCQYYGVEDWDATPETRKATIAVLTMLLAKKFPKEIPPEAERLVRLFAEPLTP